MNCLEIGLCVVGGLLIAAAVAHDVWATIEMNRKPPPTEADR